MKNMFSVGTDNFKFKVQSSNNTDIYTILKFLVGNFPFIKVSLALDDATNTKKDFISKIRNMDISALLDYAIKSCEAYLLPEDSIIHFSYPQEMTEDDANNLLSVCMFDTDNHRFHIYPVNRFYQPVKLWLIMSALYSESLQDMNCPFEEKLAPLHISSKACDDIQFNLNAKSHKGNERVSQLCYTSPLDSYYEVMVVNGLLSNDFKEDGSISTKQTKNDPLKYSDRLPDNTIPSFTWHYGHDIGFESKDLDFKLITQYLIERITCANLAHYREYVKTFMHDLKEHFNESNNSIPDSVFDRLSLYPLLHFRLNILYYLLNTDQESQNHTEPTKEEWLNFAEDLMYQTFVYFPLLDCIFHVLLKIKYGDYLYHADLCNELKHVYESEPLYQKSKKFFAYTDRSGVHKKVVKISLPDGRYFSVEYKTFRPNLRPDTTKQVVIAMVVNRKAPDFSNCIKDAFGSVYEKIKDIPETMFESFIINVIKECDGYVLFDDYQVAELGPDADTTNVKVNDKIIKSFDKHYMTCIKESFPGYEEIIKHVPVKPFNDFIRNIITNFAKDEFEYLFQYINNGFLPVNWIVRDLDDRLYGIQLKDFEERVKIISDKIAETYSARNSVNSYISMAFKLDGCLKETKSLVQRNYQYISRICAFLTSLLTESGYKLPDKHSKDKIKKYISQFKYDYDKDQKDIITQINSLCRVYERIPTNNEYRDKRKLLNRKEFRKELKEKTIQSINSFLNKIDDFFTNDKAPSINSYVQSIKERNEKFNRKIMEYMHFNINNLGKGDTEFYGELNNILGPFKTYDRNKYKKDHVKKAQIFNSYDMVQLIKAIEYYNYLNSEYMSGLDNLDSVISDLMRHDKIKNYRSPDYYQHFKYQLPLT